MAICLESIKDEGDRVKFCQIDHLYRDKMMSVARDICRNDADAEDAVQDAMVSIIKNIEKLDSADSLRTRAYVSLVAERKALDILRKRKVRLSMEYDDNLNGLSIDHERSMVLTECVCKLPPNQREIFILHYGAGYSVAEIASMINKSIAGTKKMMQRANAKFKEVAREAGLL